MKLLIVDPNEVVRRQLFWAVRKDNDIQEAASRSEAALLISGHAPEVVLLEPLEEGDPDDSAGIAFVEQLLSAAVPPLIIIITRSDRKETAQRLLGMGVFDFMRKPLNVANLPAALGRAERRLSYGVTGAPTALVPKIESPTPAKKADQKDALSLGVIGVDPQVQKILAQVRRIAPTSVSVLITGETGTGKEVFAQAIHELSTRRNQRFVALNCAVLSDTLVEDELFGHEKGAFTGAVDRRRGRFELANNGTLFLDEIGDLSHPLQSKFLRVLQEKQFERLGASQPIETDFRLISATHRNLSDMAREGIFREDLIFRLNVVSFHLPPLRERRGDIKLLATHFLGEYAQSFQKPTNMSFSREVSQYLLDHPWPGNVRELKHFVERAVALSDGRVIGRDVIPEVEIMAPDGPVLSPDSGKMDGMVRNYKRQLILQALDMAGNNKIEAARILGISRSHLFKLISQLGISTKP